MQYSVVKYSEALKEDRFGAEFWKSDFLDPLKLNRNWQPIGKYLEKCEYGISIKMNENNGNYISIYTRKLLVYSQKRLCRYISLYE